VKLPLKVPWDLGQSLPFTYHFIGRHSMVSYQINVYGRVQGVGFRWFTQQAAERHHISGWVRNKADGSVEMAILGETVALLLIAF